MSNDRAFWEGRTCNQMAGLCVKVTFEDGTVITGKTNVNGDIEYGACLCDGIGCDKFIPRSYVKSIELLDDPEYERINDIEDVQVGDIFVQKNGNKYPVSHVDDDKCTTRTCAIEVQPKDGDCYVWAYDSAFAYALRLKSRLPDKNGLWFDKNDCEWVVCQDGTDMQCIRNQFGWIMGGMVCGTQGDQARKFAPFRPAKTVDA